ncbi:ABC transporter ATP-binding protein [Corynebacterium confusum]|uniref:ABC transporter ATP-binding protein n=1 Tax=Corynebacterium confusum TaxID=71254 RepID=UPI0025B5D858|nr:ABC transporter ATP-binding protein [Corynebacterium confusum]WJY88838.1 Sulfate/thiosulfate import ATP-binding protein CysA [Corynebacterium confusum]
MSTPHVVLDNLTKTYGSKTVLQELSLTLDQSELVALLGPSGCGKTTTLKILAGLEAADRGLIQVGGKDISKVPTRKRNMGIVFQAYSLFPHMTAKDNVAYGLKIGRQSTAARRKRAEELLELVGLTEHMDKYPAQLSGGQQQRVALARALAISPQLLLLDEPLSALDATVRSQLRDEIRRIQLAEGITTLLVTHDQEEALVMADRIGVMNAGVIEQIGTPSEVYHTPRSPFISQFVGVVNRIPGLCRAGRISVLGNELDIRNADHGVADGTTGVALIRPEEIEALPDSSGPYRVLNKQLRGLFTSVKLTGPDDAPVRVDMSSLSADRFHAGQPVSLRLLSRGTTQDVVVDKADGAATVSHPASVEGGTNA